MKPKAYVPLGEKFSDRDLVWRLAHRDQVRRERFSRIKRGIITPYFNMKPQMMIKNKQGDWVPEVKGIIQ